MREALLFCWIVRREMRKNAFFLQLIIWKMCIRDSFQAIEQEITAIRTVRDEKIAALRQEIRDSKNIDKSSK